jgi:hypothetical protein
MVTMHPAALEAKHTFNKLKYDGVADLQANHREFVETDLISGTPGATFLAEECRYR